MNLRWDIVLLATRSPLHGSVAVELKEPGVYCKPFRLAYVEVAKRATAR